jgi:hypothetical protein
MTQQNNLDPIISEQIARHYIDSLERLEGRFYSLYWTYNIPALEMAKLLINKATIEEVEAVSKKFKASTLREPKKQDLTKVRQ